ncbi:hypothetical protein MMC10_010496 [Thelotrema lepadinum]|nr:hypothetical protein [Thelotrema lepadinum]
MPSAPSLSSPSSRVSQPTPASLSRPIPTQSHRRFAPEASPTTAQSTGSLVTQLDWCARDLKALKSLRRPPDASTAFMRPSATPLPVSIDSAPRLAPHAAAHTSPAPVVVEIESALAAGGPSDTSTTTARRSTTPISISIASTPLPLSPSAAYSSPAAFAVAIELPLAVGGPLNARESRPRPRFRPCKARKRRNSVPRDGIRYRLHPICHGSGGNRLQTRLSTRIGLLLARPRQEPVLRVGYTVVKRRTRIVWLRCLQGTPPRGGGGIGQKASGLPAAASWAPTPRLPPHPPLSSANALNGLIEGAQPPFEGWAGRFASWPNVFLGMLARKAGEVSVGVREVKRPSELS